MSVSQLTHARHDPALGIASVFAVLPRVKSEKRPKLDVRQSFDGAEIHLRGPDALGAGDQFVLLTLQALGAVQDLRLDSDVQSEFGRALRANLKLEGDVTGETFVAVRCTWCELAAAIGLKGRGGSTRDQVRQSVQRLADVGVWVTVEKTTVRSQLLAWGVGDEDAVTIALNWRLSRAICGGQHVRISLVERRQLRSEPAQVLHCWLSSFLRAGQRRQLSINSLVSRVWHGPASGSTLRTRESTLVMALREIDHLEGWTVELDGEVVIVGRSARVRTPTLSCQNAAPENPSNLESARVCGELTCAPLRKNYE